MKTSLTKEFLYEQCVNQKKTINEIAIESDYHYRTVQRQINKFQIPYISAKFNDLTDTKCGLLHILYKTDLPHDKSYNTAYCSPTKWYCKCDCGNIKIIPANFIRPKDLKSCGCLQTIGTWTGTKYVSGYFYGRCKKAAKDRNIEFNITIQDIESLYFKQNKKCALSGVEIYFCTKHMSKKKYYHTHQTASLDRIDSLKAYTTDNIQLVHKIINLMKLDQTQQNFINWCKLVCKEHST